VSALNGVVAVAACRLAFGAVFQLDRLVSAAPHEVTSTAATDASGQHGGVAFTTTHWSVVLEAQGESPAAQEALEKLCRTYWRPIFAYFVIRSFPTLVVFMAGGTLTEASGGTAPALQTGGKGVWSHTVDSTYAFRFKDFTFNAQNVFTGWVIITGETTVDETGNANAGPASVEVYNPNGVLVATLCADAVGTRFEL
jgi:hypothetical protein